MAEKIRERLNELEAEFTQIYKDLCNNIRDAELALEKEGATALDVLRSLRKKLMEFRSRLISSRIELRSMMREARLSMAEDEAEELAERVDEFFDRWGEALESLVEDVRELSRSVERARGRVVTVPDLGKIIEQSLEQTAKNLEAALAKLKEAFEKGSEGPSYAVSVRLPQRDLEVVDALVEAGIFKSRSEAIAFFAHRGIEASRPLFKEALAKLEELKMLREKLREELKRAFEEQPQGQSDLSS